MKPSMIAQRSAQAQAQILALVTMRAAGVDIDTAALAVTHHDPAIQAMLRWEALAVLLTTLLDVPAPVVTPAKVAKKGETHAN